MLRIFTASSLVTETDWRSARRGSDRNLKTSSATWRRFTISTVRWEERTPHSELGDDDDDVSVSAPGPGALRGGHQEARQDFPGVQRGLEEDLLQVSPVLSCPRT